MIEYYAQPGEAELREARDERSFDLRRSLTGFTIAALALYSEVKYGTGMLGGALLLGGIAGGVWYGGEWLEDVQDVRYRRRQVALSETEQPSTLGHDECDSTGH